MSLYTPTTWVNGGVPAIDQTNLNNIESGIVEAHKFYGGRWYRATSQTITSGSFTNVSWTDESFDVGGYLTPAGTQITIPADHGGYFEVKAQVHFAANAAAGRRQLRLLKNGVTGTDQSTLMEVPSASTTLTETLLTSGTMQLDAAEFFTVEVWQNSGSSLNLAAGLDTTWVSLTRLGD